MRKKTRHEVMPNVDSSTTSHGLPGLVAPSVERPRESQADSYWILESLALFVSYVSFFAMVIVFVKFNNRRLGDWHSTITLNTIVAIASIVSKAALILPVTNGLSQLKWVWYRHGSGRRLMDFEYFDAASRGPWGALVMIFHVRTFPVATVGAVIMAAALVFEPFIQQAVMYPSRNITAGVAEMPRTDYWNGAFDSSFRVAAYDALLGFNLSKTASAISPTCATGNCSFPDYSSLAVCSQCVDVSSYLSLSSGDAQIAYSLSSFGCSEYTPYNATSINGTCPSRITAPNGLSLDYTIANTQSASPWVNNESGLSAMNTSTGPLISDMLDAQTLTYTFLGNLSVLARTVPKPTAYDCVISTCAKRYAAQVANGQFHEQVQKTFHNASQIDASRAPYNGSGVQAIGPGTTPENLGFNLTITIPANSSDTGTDELFSIDYVSAGSITYFLLHSLEGNIVSSKNYSNGSFEPSFPTSDYMRGLWEHGTENIPRTLDDLATAWTNNIRQAGQPAQGTAVQGQTFIHVQFQWLILPCALELLALLFLSATILQTSNVHVPLWKASSLAPLIHGPRIANWPLPDLQLETNSGMEQFATATKTHLTADNSQWRMLIKDGSRYEKHDDLPLESGA